MAPVVNTRDDVPTTSGSSDHVIRGRAMQIFCPRVTRRVKSFAHGSHVHINCAFSRVGLEPNSSGRRTTRNFTQLNVILETARQLNVPTRHNMLLCRERS